MKIHIVQKGDTLWKLAKQYGVDFEQLKAANTQLSNPDMIMPGMKIKIPTGSVPVKKEAPLYGKHMMGQPVYKKEEQKAPPAKHTPKPQMPHMPSPPTIQQPLPKPEMPHTPPPVVQQPPQVPTPPAQQPTYGINQNLYETNMNVHLYKPQQKMSPPVQAPKEKVEKKKEVKEQPKQKAPKAPVYEPPVQAPVTLPQPQLPPQQPTYQQPTCQQPTHQQPMYQQPMQPMCYPVEPCFIPIGPVMSGCANCGSIMPQAYGQCMPVAQPFMQQQPFLQGPQMMPTQAGMNQMLPPQAEMNQMMPAQVGMNQMFPNEQMPFFGQRFEEQPFGVDYGMQYAESDLREDDEDN